MINTTEEIMNKIWNYANPKDQWEYKILKDWGESIIDEAIMWLDGDAESEVEQELKGQL